jgi:hypothetical protein
MQKWQYSRLFYFAEKKAVIFWVFDGKGQPVKESSFSYIPDNVPTFVYQSVAMLGAQGWEMVSGAMAQTLEFWFKRPVSEVSAETAPPA